MFDFLRSTWKRGTAPQPDQVIDLDAQAFRLCAVADCMNLARRANRVEVPSPLFRKVVCYVCDTCMEEGRAKKAARAQKPQGEQA